MAKSSSGKTSSSPSQEEISFWNMLRCFQVICNLRLYATGNVNEKNL
jgi:hypothetical protein